MLLGADTPDKAAVVSPHVGKVSGMRGAPDLGIEVAQLEVVSWASKAHAVVEVPLVVGSRVLTLGVGRDLQPDDFLLDVALAWEHFGWLCPVA